MFPHKLKNKQILLTFAIIIIIGPSCFFSGYFIAKNKHHTNDASDEYINLKLPEESSKEISESAETLDKVDLQTYYADVKGEVINPGVYEFLSGQRIGQIIEKAGGLTAEADRNQINLAAFAEDAMNIYIPKIGEETVPETINSDSTAKATTNSDTVNINNATSEQLQTISGIGTVTAQAIIDYRNENGNFKTIEDLKNVSGIGDKTFEKIKSKISVTS